VRKRDNQIICKIKKEDKEGEGGAGGVNMEKVFRKTSS
jgi:hypothetical protein